MTDFRHLEGLERLEPSAVRETQEELLKAHILHASLNSKFYRELFSREGIDPDTIGIDNIHELPFTDKSHLEDRIDDFLAVPMAKVRDIVLSSGTTGKPTKMMYSDTDLRRLAFNEKTAFERVGLTPDDVVLLTCTMDRCFIAGLAYYSGVREIGASAVRNGLSTPASHMEIIRRMDPTVLVGVPSFLHKLGLFLSEQGIDPRGTSVDKLVCIGEPIRDRELNLISLGSALEELWGCKVYSTYASSETVTTFCECTEQKGGHLHPALGVVEIVDEDGSPLPPGEVGEVVMTPLLVEGVPLLRFRTGDVSFLMDEPCACGRVSQRLGPVMGRKKQMIKCHGTTLYPQAIYEVLDGMKEVSDYYVVVSSDFALSDNVDVYVSLRGNSCTPENIQERLQARLRVKPGVIIADERDVRKQVFAENSRKPVRFIDRRCSGNGVL